MSVASTALRQLSKPVRMTSGSFDLLSTWPPWTISPRAPIAAAGSMCWWRRQRARPAGAGGVHVLLEKLARRDADAVVGGGDVDDVRRVHVEPDAGRLGVGAQPRGGAARADPRAPPTTR